MASNSDVVGPSSASPIIDIMNGPTYAPDASQNPNDTGIQESDHCRICRSEGSADEPLYHPCKCSGSIKFVHQDWSVLSGSPRLRSPDRSLIYVCMQFDGMATTLAKEILRTVQDTLYIHEALRPRHATNTPDTAILTSIDAAARSRFTVLGKGGVGGVCLVGLLAVVRPVDVAGLVLGERWWVVAVTSRWIISIGIYLDSDSYPITAWRNKFCGRTWHNRISRISSTLGNDVPGQRGS